MVKNNERLKHRRSGHLPDYDYSLAGAYFVTTCTYNREEMLGVIQRGSMALNQFGRVVEDCWHDLPYHYPSIRLDAFVVMPNHVHGVVVLTDADRLFQGTASSVGAGLHRARPIHETSTAGPNTLTDKVRPRPAPTEETARRVSLHEVVRALKSFSALRINGIRNARGVPVWERGYHDHVIRTEDDLKDIREYIINNPMRWSLDPDNPDTLANQP